MRKPEIAPTLHRMNVALLNLEKHGINSSRENIKERGSWYRLKKALRADRNHGCEK